MSEVNKYKSDFAERLPKHSPGKDLWPGIAQSLNAGSASLTDRLPKHKPAGNLWPLISRKLPLPWYSLRSIYMRSALAGLVIILLLIFWNYGNQDQIKNKDSQQIVQDEKTQKGISTSSEIINESVNNPSENQKPENTSPLESGMEAIIPDYDVVERSEEQVQFFEKSADEILETNLPKTAASVAKADAKTLPGLENAGANIPPESTDFNSLPEMNAMAFFDRNGKFSGHSKSPKHQASEVGKFSLAKEVDFEAGIFFQPSMIKDISTIHDDWVYSPGIGASIGMVQNRFLLETGVSLSRVEFEDKIEVDYFAFVFLGTVITPTQQFEEYVNEQGDTITQVIYSVEVIDVYDSVFVEDEKNDIVKLSTTTIPLTAGYRIYDQGNKYLDLKTGLDMMIVTGRVIPGNPEQENIKVTDVRNSIASKYTLKWKYHISLGAGLRISERMALYAEPSLWWYPDGIRNGETMGIKHPFEAGLKIGLKWTF